MNTTLAKVGEVVQAATAELLVQSYHVNEAPPLGALVQAAQGEGVTVYGVVASIQTAPADPSRKPLARGEAADSLQAIYNENPQLTELFATHFTVRVLGYAQSDEILHAFPPLPPEIHQLVYACPEPELVRFTESLSFLPLLLGDRENLVATEVIIAFLRHASQARGADGRSFMVGAGKRLVGLLRGDPIRLSTLLERLA